MDRNTKKTNWIPWIIGGVIVLILIYFSLQGGIGAAVDEPVRPTDTSITTEADAPAGVPVQ